MGATCPPAPSLQSSLHPPPHRCVALLSLPSQFPSQSSLLPWTPQSGAPQWARFIESKWLRSDGDDMMPLPQPLLRLRLLLLLLLILLLLLLPLLTR